MATMGIQPFLENRRVNAVTRAGLAIIVKMPDGVRVIQTRHVIGAAIVLLVCGALVRAQSGRSYGADRVWWEAGRDDIFPWEESYDDPEGLVTIVNADGAIHTRGHAFFAALGSNGRACITCHQPSNAMSVSVVSLRERWVETDGKDAVFAAIDGSNCPDLPQSARSSHSLLLDRGLFRIALPWPPRNAEGAPIRPEFRIEVVRDPTGCNTNPVYGLKSSHPSISVFRRPRVAANLKYALAGDSGAVLMADAREPSVQAQASTAALVHEQAGSPPSPEQLRQIVEFESQIFVAQSADIRGGLLNERDGPPVLGPQNLAAGRGVRLDGHLEAVSFDSWRTPKQDLEGLQREFRASVARGSDVFFQRSFQIHDVFASRGGEAAAGTCATCHAAGIVRWMDIGTTSGPSAEASSELPLFRITCEASAPAHAFRGQVIYTQDPGRGLISGKCADVGAIVMQQFRGLAARAPYFSNGSAKDLKELVDFYDRRFEIRFTEREKQDLVNFLTVL